MNTTIYPVHEMRPGKYSVRCAVGDVSRYLVQQHLFEVSQRLHQRKKNTHHGNTSRRAMMTPEYLAPIRSRAYLAFRTQALVPAATVISKRQYRCRDNFAAQNGTDGEKGTRRTVNTGSTNTRDGGELTLADSDCIQAEMRTYAHLEERAGKPTCWA